MRPSPQDFALAQVCGRFLLRLIVLTIFGSFSTEGFAKTLAGLLLLAAFFCTSLAVIRREDPLAPVLTHWDEAAAYAVLGRLVTPLG